MEQYFSYSPEETFEKGYQLGAKMTAPKVLCFFGDLAAGKTTFIKGFVAGAAQIDPSFVQSPTFTYMHVYEGQQTVYHFDLYRLNDIDEFVALGLIDYLDADGICCLEWSERIANDLPSDCIHIHLEHVCENQRKITITP